MTIRLDLDVNATGTGSVTNFYEQTPALLFPAASLSTINQAGATITEATVTLTGALATETLALDSTGAALAAANGVSAAYNASSGVFTLQGADTLADSTWTSLLEHIAYNNTAENPAGPRSVTVVASDNNLAVSALATDLISVTPVNDAPSGANKAVTVSKGSAYTLAASDFGFTDAKDTPANALAGVKLTTVASGLLLNGAAVSAGTVVSVSDITAGLLTFNGTANASFTFQVQDNGGTANGGVDLDPTARSFGFTVDTAPAASFTTPTYSAAEGTALNLRTGNLVVSDADGTTSSETVTLSVGEGTLTAAAGSSGVTITGSGTPTLTLKGTVAQLSNLFSTTAGQGTLTYLDSVAAPSASTTLTMTAVDAFGLAASPASASVAISPTNNAPVNTVPSGTTILANNASRAITGLAISDADAGGAANLTTTLTATHGTVAAGAVAGGAVVAGSGTTALTLTGSVAQINATLAGSNVVFTPDAAYTGAATLTVLTNDAGNTGSGGAKTDSDAVALTIGAPPVVDLNGVAAGTGSSVAYTEKAPAVLIAPSATVTDADNTVLGWNGWLMVSFNGTGSAGDVLSIRNQGTGANQIGFDGT
jgi:hypothetical protein